MAPRFPELRTSVIHNDANDNNILVQESGSQVKSIIDFGDMVHTYTICELAIAIAYMILDKEDLLHVARQRWRRGITAVYPLEPSRERVCCLT